MSSARSPLPAWPRRVAGLGAAAALLLGLTSCMTIDTDLHVATDDTLSGTIVLAADRGVLATSGTSEQQFLQTLNDQNRTTQIPARSEASVEPYLTERLVGNRYVYHRVPLRDFSAASGDWRIQHVEDRFVVSGELDFSGGAPGADQEAMADAWDVTVRIAFPGAVRSANGAVDGKTVTWRPEYGERTTLAAEADDGSGDTPWWVYGVAAAGGGVLAAGIAVTVLAARRRSRRA